MDEPATGASVPATDSSEPMATHQQQQKLIAELSNVDQDLAAVASAEEFLMQNRPEKMLPYQHEMFVDVMQSDCLVVCAKGLNYNEVVINLLLAHSDPANLVLVINGAANEEHLFRSRLPANQVHESSTKGHERELTYLLGGTQFISTRILIVDLLKKRIPIELITGIVVLRAHRIIESCQEAFALRIYRQHNRTGFVKAFSQCVEAFTAGFGHVEKVMRNLFVRELYIWPRFHASVQRSFRPYESPAVELHVPISASQTRIQNNVLDIMNLMVREMKRLNRFVDLKEVTVENCITKRFHKIMQSQLDCIWHQLSGQTKQLLADLKVLRSIMISTIYNDSISLYAQLRNFRSQKYAFSNSGWVLSDAADQMFRYSRERVFNSDDEFDPEPCPKWQALSSLLRVEIPKCVQSSLAHNPNALLEPVKVLVLCQDSRTCYQLNQYLTMGAERHLLCRAMQYDVPIAKLSERFRVVQELDAMSDRINLQTQSEAAAAARPTTTDVPLKLVTNATKAADLNVSDKPKAGGFLRDRLAKRKMDKTAAATSATPSSKRRTVDELELGMGDNDVECDANGTQNDSNVDDARRALEDADAAAAGALGDGGDVGLFRDTYLLAMTQTLSETLDNSTEANMSAAFDTSGNPTTNTSTSPSMPYDTFVEMANVDVTQMVQSASRPVVCIRTFKTEMDDGPQLGRTLEELRPGFVIMYDSSVTAIRQLEGYEAMRAQPLEKRMRIYFLMHSMTVEEQSHLTNLRREKQAFELLIETKRSMVVPEYQDGKSDDMLAAHRLRNATATVAECPDEAPGQREAIAAVPSIIVDMREFRSELPCLIHRRGIEVLPVTITVGDYILTPDICVERKSISDLIGSLNSGRLYTQCVQMQRYYARPILLIEFDQNKPFHMQRHYMMTAGGGGGSDGAAAGVHSTGNADIMKKLQLLTMHFPRLRLMWSPSPYATAQLFEELKLNRPEPEAKKAMACGLDEAATAAGGEGIDNFADRINSTLYDFLLKLGGITDKNVVGVLRRCKDMKDLLRLSEEELVKLLGGHSTNAKVLWKMLHDEHKVGGDAMAATSASTGATGGRNFRPRGGGMGGGGRRFQGLW